MRSRVFHSGGPAVDVEFCLVFPREALSVPVMRRVLGDTLSRLGLGEACVDDLLLAVTEACTNVLRHAGPGRRYEVVARIDSKRCVVDVVDGGRGFDAARLGFRRVVRPSAGGVVRLRKRTPVPTAPAPGSPGVLASRIISSRRKARDEIPAELPESGRGLAIMKACVDDVSLRSRPGQGTVVSLRKQIEWRTDAPLSLLPASQLRDAG